MSGMALNKRGNVFMGNKRIYFVSKFVRILMCFTLLVIPIFIYAIIVNFEISGLILIILMSGFIIYLCYFLNTYGFNINENEVIYYSFLKHVFEVKNIKSISVTEKGAIEVVYNNKKYGIGGYIDFLAQTSNPQKNKELVVLLNKKYFEKKKWFKNRV